MPSFSPQSAMQSGIDAQLSFMTELTRRSYDSVRKLSELHMHFSQQLMQDTVEATRQMMTCNDPFQLMATAANASQPAVQHLRSYQQQLVGMLTGAQVEMTRTAETLMPQASRYTSAMLQTMSRNMPSNTAGPADTITTSSDPLGTAVRGNGAAQESHGSNGAHHTPG